MIMNRAKVWFVVGALAVSGIFSQGTIAIAETNSWIETGAGGNWATSVDWFYGSPSLVFDAIQINNHGIKTITIDSTTPADTLTISNLVLGGQTSGTFPTFNTLALTNAGTPLTIENTLTLSGSSAITIDNSSLMVGVHDIAPTPVTFSDNATVTLNSGQLNLNLAVVGDASSGMFMMNGGSLSFSELFLGSVGAPGTMIVNGGSISAPDDFVALSIGSGTNASGSLWVNGGTLNLSGDTFVGYQGTGQMIVSNGTILGFFFIGASPGGQGTLTIAGGTIVGNVYAASFVGAGSAGTGTVWMTGGSLTSTNVDQDGIFIGTRGLGQMTMSNGTVTIDDMGVGNGTFTLAGGSCTMSLLDINNSTAWVSGGQLIVTQKLDGAEIDVGGIAQMTVSNGTIMTDVMRLGGLAGSDGTFTVAGGSSSVFSNVTIGSGCASPGTVIVAGGGLFVTNATHNAVLDLESGTLTLSGGTLVADIFVKTNPCGFFQQTGGTLVVGGVTNVVSPPFSITAISRVGNDVRITWQTPGGVTNTVQATDGGPGGNYATNFADLSSQFILPGGSPITTNYLDVGGATNIPARFYRVRVVP
jgi:hypothetical protein